MNVAHCLKKLAEAVATHEREPQRKADRLDPETSRVVSAARATIKGDWQMRGGQPWEPRADQVERHVRELAREQGTEVARVWALGRAHQLRAERATMGIDEVKYRSLTDLQSQGANRCGIAIGMLRPLASRTRPPELPE